MKHHILRLTVLVTAVLAAFSCGSKKNAAESPDTAFAEYIKAYTGGIIADDAVIRVDFTGDVEEAARKTSGLFNISPSVPGTVRWNSPSSVIYVPEEGALKVGQTYAVSIDLDKITQVSEEALKQFNFGFTVKGRGASPKALEKPEPDNGRPFRVVTVREVSGDTPSIDVVFSKTPSNATLKGMVELEGAGRSYVQVQDSLLQVFYENRRGDLTLTLDRSLKSEAGETLGDNFVRTFARTEEVPAVSIPLKGNILPDKSNLILPFSAVNLSAVEVRVVKIYEKNVLMYLQDNDLGEEGSLRRSGRLVWKGDVALDASKDLHQWHEHSIDLSNMIKKEPGAIYRIRLSFRLDQSLYGGKDPMRTLGGPTGAPSKADDDVWDTQSSYYWENDYDWENYDWEDSNNPEKPSFYMDSDRFPSVQLLASDIGLMAEYADGDKLWLAATDLLTAKPLSGVNLEVYDYQLQEIAKVKTDGKGLAEATLPHKPFAVVAKHGGSIGYLKISSGAERSLSRFDVGGEVLQQGIKSFIYGERGVWRPGDTLHVTMLLSDKGHNLPEGHPATLELYTPEGQFHTRMVRSGKDGFYSYSIPTKADDPTGYWNAYFKVGGNTFYNTLHVETVKPNRLNINTRWADVLNAGERVTVRTAADWLAGGVAADCPVRAEMTLRKLSGAPFAGFEKYTFNDPSSNFSNAEYVLYNSRLSGSGEASVQVDLPAAEGAPGMLSAFIVTSVMEPGGDESFTTETLPYSPYSSYVGIKLPESDNYYLETDKDQTVNLAVVDASGKRVRGHKIEYAVYKVGWSWWWDNPGGDLDSYVNGNSVQKLTGGTVTSSGDKDASFVIREEYPNWGRYLVLARDLSSGHVTGEFFTFDWPDFRGRAGRQDPQSLTMLTFSTDKPSYKAGEKATVYIPAAPGGQALVSLENASGVIRREWVSTGDKDTPYKFDIQPEMSPNFYVHITLLQPYGSTVNDLPLRLYGVQKVKVENPDSHLEPVIKMPDVLHPEEAFTVKISEKSGKPMTYTLAIVDEGLLDLTAYKTPNPWSVMYKDEALGVKTWDLYDKVIGAFSGKFSPLAAIGGDQENLVAARKDNRFNPVVLFQAPRTLTKGTDEIKLQLPQYVGSVRVMVVAGHDGAYGSTDATVPVQSPLMVVTTLPRILGNGEEVTVPVNVFAMEDGVKSANVKITVDGPANVVGESSKTVSFPEKGDQLVSFGLKATGEGVTHVTIDASGAGHKATETIALTIQNPNPEIATVKNFQLAAGASETLNAGAGSTLQLSGFPALDARSLYISMRDYAYDCSEQLSSKGLTMLHLMPMLEEKDAAEAKTLIPGIIEKLYSRQTADGGFAYWSSSKQADTWVTSMAGEFLSEASKAGFEVNKGVLKNWESFQKKMSQAYRIAGNNAFSHLDECYRLYTMAATGNANLSAMNRLREAEGIGDRAKWMLASAYALAGKSKIAEDLINEVSTDFPEYLPYNLTYGTSFRDRMVALEALALTGRITAALPIAQGSVETMNWLSTQESAFAAIAFHRLFEKVGTSAIKASVNGSNVASNGSVATVPASGNITVKNNADGLLYGTLVTVSRPAAGEVVPARSNGLRLEVTYKDEQGRTVNPARLMQGMRFSATLKVYNTAQGADLENLALSCRIPSGWEIQNDRLMGGAGDEGGYDHKDIRDDRVNWFFGLPAGKVKTFTVQLRAAYEGSFALPAIVCEAMYQPSINASTASGSAVVNK
ncbi:MAG: alpha-2-macroglobulin [Bacteroidales bacterium]|nr:alpha-2-macroglobulin [Bacteroidales bacterium]